MGIKQVANALAAGTVAVGLYKKLTGVLGKKPQMSTPSVNWVGVKDLRVKLLVPNSYLESDATAGYQKGQYATWRKHMQQAGGIVFPNTPSISYENAAHYTPTQLMHSNYAYYSYKNSSIGAISLTTKLTVQSDDDAMMYLSIIHLLRSLTKMKFGEDFDAGAPPPICRLDGYGDFMFKNVPVAVSSFKIDLPDGVDYYRTYSDGGSSMIFLGDNVVPTVSTLALTLIPVYSRNEQLAFSADNFRDSTILKSGGFL